MSAVLPEKKPLTVDEYLEWGLAQSQGRYELVDGEIIAMASERALHNRVKSRIWRALSDAIERAGAPCEAFTDGMTIRISDHTAREPDALVICGTDLGNDAVEAPAPIIVVEVISPTSARSDTTDKLSDYFSVPGIRHYLILDGDKRLAVHHTRGSEPDDIRSRIIRQGAIVLDPPGLSFALSEVFPSET